MSSGVADESQLPRTHRAQEFAGSENVLLVPLGGCEVLVTPQTFSLGTRNINGGR